MNSVEQAYANLCNSFEFLKKTIRTEDKNLYEQWKAGGFLVDENVVSMYPNIHEVYDRLYLD